MPEPAADPVTRSRRGPVVAIACAGAFLAFLDTTIVNTSFPDIAASFPEARRSELSWILDAYFVVLAALLVPAGMLADRFGRKRTFLLATAGFLGTSVLCALAPSWETLVAARVLQGASAALLAPVSLALVLAEFGREERSAGVGIWGAAAAAAAAFGPPLGGVIVEVWDWRGIFLVNVPITIAVLVLGRRLLRESRDERATGLPDLVGSALTVGGLGLLALAIVEGGAWGWTSTRTLAAFAVALVLIALVIGRSSRHPRPIVDLALMRIPSFALGNLGSLLFATAFFSTILGNILFLTTIWDYSVFTAGFATIPGPVVTTLFAAPAGRLADRYGHRVVIVPGCLIYVAALAVLGSAGSEPDYLGTWLPGMVLNGIAVGLAFPTLGAAAAADVPADRFGAASALNAAFRQFGAVLGTAILTAVVGDPSPQDALAAAHHGYLVGIVAAVLAAVVSLGLRPEPARRERLAEISAAPAR